jgi:hypothetical protein
MVLGDHGYRGGVDGVGLASVSGVEQARSGGQLGGHVQNWLTSAGQALGDAATEAGCAFDRSLTLGPAAGPGPQPGQGLGRSIFRHPPSPAAPKTRRPKSPGNDGKTRRMLA